LPGELYPKIIIVINLFNFSKSSEQRIEDATFRCCNQNSQQYKINHQERIDESLNDGLKDLMIVIKVQSSKEKLSLSAETDSKRD
jgi:hypothetical protein